MFSVVKIAVASAALAAALVTAGEKRRASPPVPASPADRSVAPLSAAPRTAPAIVERCADEVWQQAVAECDEAAAVLQPMRAVATDRPLRLARAATAELRLP